ncbi:threonine dehydratase [Aspergillus costaricaensis CBS 115574]|uniref:Threonine dehydratase n=1 Tax=Aspergillus costaricaensis CBS 115574 TaxID=1448317 RepID=A0ACD1IBB3_9EURO|nr:threonine dehydratase [Aspergillus costaricaensis CBS 115574]RAK87822.1 threonine dehydratase [Aspergillus costaricaensis CBS 115574]
MSFSLQEIAANAVQARSRIRQHIYQTPLIPARRIGHDHDAKVLFKAENFQLTGSFKIRGALAKLSSPSAQGRLVTASSGNHGIGASFAAKVLAKNLTVVLPTTVVQAKLEKIKSFGVEVILHGVETGQAEQHAQQLASSGSYTYISPYNDADLIAGQGTIGLDILEQVEEVDNVFISMGGGGLLSGVGSVLKAFRPQTKIYGVSAKNSKALAVSIMAGHVVETDHLPTLAEAVAGGIDEDTITLSLASAVVDYIIECDEAEILRSLKALAAQENMIAEGSAALALAGFNKVAEKLTGQTSVILLCGGNVDHDFIQEVLCR